MTALLLLCAMCLPVVPSQSSRLMAAAIGHALSAAFNVAENNVDVTIQTDAEENKLFFLDVLEGILRDHGENLHIQVDVNNEEFGTISDFNLWFLDSLEAFRKLNFQIRGNRRDSIVYFLIALKLTNEDPIHLMHHIFTDLFRLAIVHVNLILETSSGEVVFYSFFPFTESSCRSTVPVLVNRFDGNALRSSDIFPPKVDNFHGCAVRLIAHEGDFLLHVDRLIQGLEQAGLEGEILQEMSERLNFTFHVVSRDPDGRSYKRLEDGEADIMVGFLLKDRLTSLVFTTSHSYLYTWLVIALRRPPHTLPQLSWLVSEFDNATWAYVALVLAIPAVCIELTIRTPKLMEFFNVSRRSLGFFVILELALGTAVRHPPRGTYLRCCFVIGTVGMLLIRTSYQGKMFDSYRRLIHPRPPMTVQALLDHNYIIYTRPDYISMVSELSESFTFSYKELKNVDVIKDPVKKNAIIVSKFLLFSKLSPDDLANVVAEQLRAQHVTFLFQKHSPLAPMAHPLIQRWHDAGVIRYLRMRYEYLKLANIKAKRVQKLEPIKLQRFRYVFFIYISLQLVAVMIFLLELAWALLRRIYQRHGQP